MRTRVAPALAPALALVLGLALGAGVTACGGDEARPPPGPPPPAPAVRWLDGDGAVTSRTTITGSVALTGPATRVTLDLAHARVTAIPDVCRTSLTTRTRSFIGDAGLVCRPEPGTDRIDFDALVLGERGDTVTGAVTVLADPRAPEAARSSALPGRPIAGGPARLVPSLRLLSSPDFLNADVADLRRGPSRWNPSRSANSTNRAYDRALGEILDDWQALRPAGVLVAGDLVDGRWGYDDQQTGTFGPVGTLAEKRRAVRRAARTYYPQWLERFTQRDLPVFPAVGDHELGDNPWTDGTKRRLVSTLRQEFARALTRDAAGRSLFTERPRGPARFTAYAGRPAPDVQVITLDEFDITPRRDRIGIDPQQRRWLESVLRDARRDQVRWIIVQGHVPVLFPVRARASSRLHYPGGADSGLWRLFAQYDVDLYLSGEVHDVTAAESDGVVQISHGGAFQFGLTNALVLDFYDDRLFLTLRDYDVRTSDAADGTRLWETKRRGLRANVDVVGAPRTIGTATLRDTGLDASSGLLSPFPG